MSIHALLSMVASTNWVELYGKYSETIRTNAVNSDTGGSLIWIESMSRRQQYPHAHRAPDARHFHELNGV
jgi:hypothetical protein